MSKYLFCHLIPCTFASSFSGGDAMKNQPYFWAAFVAFFIWGFFSLALKPIAHYPSLDILFFRVFMSVGMLSLINLGMRRKKGQKDMADFKALPARDKETNHFTYRGGRLTTCRQLACFYLCYEPRECKCCCLCLPSMPYTYDGVCLCIFKGETFTNSMVSR